MLFKEITFNFNVSPIREAIPPFDFYGQVTIADTVIYETHVAGKNLLEADRNFANTFARHLAKVLDS